MWSSSSMPSSAQILRADSIRPGGPQTYVSARGRIRGDRAQVLAAQVAGEGAAGVARVGMDEAHVRMTARDLAKLAAVDDVDRASAHSG